MSGLYPTRSLSQAEKLKFNIQKTDKWKFLVFFIIMNGIENYPAAGDIFYS